jgi:hypothetical protein
MDAGIPAITFADGFSKFGLYEMDGIYAVTISWQPASHHGCHL